MKLLVQISTDNHLNHRPPPKMSVLLLTHNNEALIGQAIESIQNQTMADWELIIVDDGSTADTQAVLESYANRDDRIRLSEAKADMAGVRMQGIVQAQGDYIYCLDANYRSLPDTLQRLYDELEAAPHAAVAYGATVAMNQRDEAVRSAIPNARALAVLSRLAESGFFNAGAVAFRRTALADAEVGDMLPLEDGVLWWLLAAAGPISFVDGGPLSAQNTASALRLVSAGNPAPIKLAYLILAHHQPAHLARLIHALDDQHSAFFIHIDQNVPLTPFQAAVPEAKNIVFLANRVAVQWGKLSVVQAVLNLIQTAVASDHAFKYYTVLSGSDYPIKHRQDIYARLQASNCQYIRIDRKLTNEATNSHRHFIKDLPQGKYFGDLTPYHGSMYWSLTADCVGFMLDFVNNNPGYLDIHRSIFAPDEVFFHTIVKHSPFAAAITHDFADGVYPDHLHHGNHFIDWQGLRPRTYLTLDERDLDDLLRSDGLFARKFDEEQSSGLLALLDEQVHKFSSGVQRAVSLDG